LSGLSLVLAALVVTGCGRRLDDAECRGLLDHYTSLLVLEQDPDATPERVAHVEERARSVSRREPRFEFSKCSDRVSRSQYECAMKAPSVDEVERCLVF
jgi:hypothetical protein